MDREKLVVGIDIGGTNTVYGFMNRYGKIYLSKSIPTMGHLPAEDLVKRISNSIKTDMKKIGKDIEGIGIGAPNSNYYRGTIENPPNLNWKIVPFVKLMKSHFSVPVILTNDANAAALGELKYGAAKTMKDFILITLGTGLGSGIIVNGNIVYGYDGFAGEMGHSLVEENGRECGCGKRGCLETYVSATGICRTAQIFLDGERNNGRSDSILAEYSNKDLSSKIIAEAAEKGDTLALNIFEYTGKILGKKLADAVSLLSPEAIFLFGGLANSGKLIFDPTQKYLEEFMPKVHRGQIKLLASGLIDKNIAVLGSGALILSEIEKI